MKVFCISDNIDTQMGLRLGGIDGTVVHTAQEVLSLLDVLIKDKDMGIVLMTTKIVNLCPEVISKYKLELKSPLLVEIPDRHGGTNIGETIDSYISEAIRIKI